MEETKIKTQTKKEQKKEEKFTRNATPLNAIIPRLFERK
jgi:hypothetical protein